MHESQPSVSTAMILPDHGFNRGPTVLWLFQCPRWVTIHSGSPRLLAICTSESEQRTISLDKPQYFASSIRLLVCYLLDHVGCHIGT